MVEATRVLGWLVVAAEEVGKAVLLGGEGGVTVVCRALGLLAVPLSSLSAQRLSLKQCVYVDGRSGVSVWLPFLFVYPIGPNLLFRKAFSQPLVPSGF